MARRFPSLADLELTAERREVIEQLASGPRKVDLSAGMANVPLGPFEALLLSPQLAGRAQAIGEYIRFKSSLPGAVRELAIIFTARHWSTLLEWHVHEEIAAREGVSEAVREAVRLQQPVGIPGSMEREVCDFVGALLTHGQVDDAIFDAVAERFGARGALDLTATVGYYSFLAFVLNVDRYPLPDGVDAPFSTPRDQPAPPNHD
jgi:4-carboxymuconolactone decarboxylase